MSTKIFDAYRLIPGADVFTLRREVLTALAPPVLQTTIENLVRDSVYIFDAAVARGRHVTFTDKVRQQLREFNADEYNVLRTAQVVALQNLVRDEVYIKCYGGLTRLPQTALLSLPSVAEDFAYWDNSDGPASMSAAAWADRELAWSQSLTDPHDAVGAQGVKIDLFSAYQADLTLTKIARLWTGLRVPSIAQRCDRLGQDLYIQQYLIDNQVDNKDLVAAVSSQMFAWTADNFSATLRATFTTRAALLLQPDLTLDVINPS